MTIFQALDTREFNWQKNGRNRLKIAEWKEKKYPNWIWKQKTNPKDGFTMEDAHVKSYVQGKITKTCPDLKNNK